MSSFNLPSFSTTYPTLHKKKWHRKWYKYLKYNHFQKKHNSQLNDFTSFVNQYSCRSSIILGAARIGTALCEGYVLRQFSLQERIAVIQSDLLFAEQYFPEEFLSTQCATLADLGNGLTIKLKNNWLSCIEGLWNIGLYDGDEYVYLCTFTLGYKEQLLIGSIQGASNDSNSHIIKKTTKAMHGLRPQQLMIWLAHVLAMQFGCHELEAIGKNNHPRMSFKKRLRGKTIFLADYDKIWASYNGKKLKNGNWILPELPQKTLDEIASKKRSMYRKRYAMLEEITQSISACLKNKEQT